MGTEVVLKKVRNEKAIFRKRNAKERSKPLLLNAATAHKMTVLMVFILEVNPNLKPCVCIGWFPKLKIICCRAAPSKETHGKRTTPYTKKCSCARAFGKRLFGPDCYLLERFVQTRSTRPKQFLMRSHMVVLLCFFCLRSPREYWIGSCFVCLQTSKNILFSYWTSIWFLFSARWIWKLGERSDLAFKLGYHKRQLVDDVASAFSFKLKFGAKKLDVRCVLQLKPGYLSLMIQDFPSSGYLSQGT